MTILLILLFIFVIWPIIRFAIAVNRVKKQARQAYGSMYGNSQPRQRERKAGWTAPDAVKKKKIERGVGDYVPYEEIPGAGPSAQRSGERTAVSPEQQIVDAEWEEIQ